MTDAPTSAPRGSALPGYDQAYDRYAAWVAGSPLPKLVRTWIIMSVGAAAAVAAANFLSFGGDYAKAAICIPAAVAIYVTLLGISHWRLNSNADAVPMKSKYTPRQRRRASLVAGVLMLITFASLSSSVPFVFGGTMMMVVMFSLLNFLSLTRDERYREQEGVLDPREYPEEEYEDALPDILDDDFTWSEEENPLGDDANGQ